MHRGSTFYVACLETWRNPPQYYYYSIGNPHKFTTINTHNCNPLVLLALSCLTPTAFGYVQPHQPRRMVK